MSKKTRRRGETKNIQHLRTKQSNRKTLRVTNSSAQTFADKIPTRKREKLGGIQTLNKFIPSIGKLTLNDQKRIVEQALILLEEAYVHLPLKNAMHAVDPVRRLKILQHRLNETVSNQIGREFDFQKEMLDIFTSLRDLHTNYVLPQPFSDHTAFLPFQVESYSKDNQRRFLVTKIFGNTFPATFKAGVEITYWNGVPMQRAVEINANINAGSNLAARFARGLEAMTIRPMNGSLPPDEEWVVIGYRTEDGQELEHRQDWLVVSPDRESVTTGANFSTSKYSDKIGLDLTTDLVRQMKKIMYAPEHVLDSERRLAKTVSVKNLIKKAEGLESVMPQVFRARKISEDIGYIRIFTFSVESDEDFVNEFVRLMMQLPKKGLIIDVRANGGGLITAAERLLQLLTPRKITPQPFQFISSPLTLEMARKTSWLKSWESSLSEAVTTGSIFSRGLPITSFDEANNLGQLYHGPVILVTDALCYSATDIFAASFQDHRIGPILGADGNTGAGGANVWTHGLLRQILAGTRYELKELPSGSNMRVSIRRNERVGERAGTPVEDLGITPDIIYDMTRKDLLEENVDLLAKAAEILADMPVRQLETVITDQADSLGVELTTLGISRVDIYLDGRPVLSQDITDGISRLSVKKPSSTARVLEIMGLKLTEVVAAKKVFLNSIK